MNTHPTDEQLSAFHDAQLDGTHTRRVAAHVNECELCQDSLHQLQSVRGRLHSLPAPPALPADFWTNAARQMRVDEQRRVLPPARRFATRRLAAALAACAALGVAAFLPFASPPAAPVPDTPIAAPADLIDVSSLVQAHAQSAARQPLADADRQTLLAADGGDPLLPADPFTPDAAQ